MAQSKSKTKSKSKSKSKSISKKDDTNDMVTDPRFISATNRPQFLPKSKTNTHKVTIDSRFASLLTDPKFRTDHNKKIDKYGRKQKQKHKQQVEEELSAFYTIEKPSNDNDDHHDNDNDHDHDNDSDGSDLESIKKINKDINDNDKIDKPKNNLSRIAYLQALSRGEISGSSSSDSSSDESSDESSSSSDDDSEDDEDPYNVTPGILDPNNKDEETIEMTMEQSPNLAILNLDWVHMRAVDILVIVTSFAPPGSVKRVRVYPSDFGIERMKQEEIMGPIGIWKKQTKSENNQNNQNSDKDESESENESESEGESESESESESDSDQDIIEKAYKHFPKSDQLTKQTKNNDFDTEKLREYEASKLKYYFAVVEFQSSKDADMAYREIDGLEMEHSSSTFDVRSIPSNQMQDIIKRTMRDEAIHIPSTYVPPEFVVSALQQTNVTCTWEDGNTERSRKLTQYGVGNEMWDAMVEGDDLKAYLASDQSSVEDSDLDETKQKSSKMRTLLGLSDDDDDDDDDDSKNNNDSKNDSKNDSNSDSDSDSDSDNSTKSSNPTNTDNDLNHSHDNDNLNEETSNVKEFTYIPGKQNLKDKIQTKLQQKKETDYNMELTPWESYLEKRRAKKKEKRQARKLKQTNNTGSKDVSVDDKDDDDFFEKDQDEDKKQDKDDIKQIQDTNQAKPSTKEELELILAGDEEMELSKDYDMRGIYRIEKNAGKKLRGSRKRKEERIAQKVVGKDFKVNTEDKRFAALMDGDERYGIDRQDPNYKETNAMKNILKEQTKRRSKKRNNATMSNSDTNTNSSKNDRELGSIVKSLKNRVKHVKKKRSKSNN